VLDVAAASKAAFEHQQSHRCFDNFFQLLQGLIRCSQQWDSIDNIPALLPLAFAKPKAATVRQWHVEQGPSLLNAAHGTHHLRFFFHQLKPQGQLPCSTQHRLIID